jgi:hypothetical protein
MEKSGSMGMEKSNRAFSNAGTKIVWH